MIYSDNITTILVLPFYYCSSACFLLLFFFMNLMPNTVLTTNSSFSFLSFCSFIQANNKHNNIISFNDNIKANIIITILILESSLLLRIL